VNAEKVRTAVRWIFALWLLEQGLLTAFHAHEGPVVTLIAVTESVAAALLLWPRTLIAGAVGLLIALAAALLLHLSRGQFIGTLPAYMLVVILLLAEPRP